MQMKTYSNMFEVSPDIGHSGSRPDDSHYVMSTTHDNPPGWLAVANI